MQNWKKLGKIFSPHSNIPWMVSHASVPVVTQIKEDVITVLFTSRNNENESSIGSLDFNINNLEVSNVSEKPLLSKGELGCFDDSGVMATSILERPDGIINLYYIGWNLGVTVPFRNAIGLAESRDGGETFSRSFSGPIIDRTAKEPHFTASCCVIFDEDKYKIWYLSCTEWIKINDKVTHKYHIKYAESQDGVNWKREGDVAIDYIDEYEYAISVPRVLKEQNIYKMWFSSRASINSSSYKIRYAESLDGKNWERKDQEVNLEESENGWDSEMNCYPFLFHHKNDLYMLYNGNGYGETGFGLALLEKR
tara:strand:- start:273 stop:1199 length:927 start_codon:yes stop_codon:yes gene_type:complete